MTLALALGAALYFDFELAADARPLVALWGRIATEPDLRSWTLTHGGMTKPVAFNPKRLASRIESGATTHVGVELRTRELLIVAGTALADRLDRQPTSPRWKYDLSVTLAANRVDAIGRDVVISALCDFAGSVAADAGVVLWSTSVDFARALSSLSSGPDLPPAQVVAYMDAQTNRAHWGAVIRGPEWGTFLSAAHVATLAGRELPVAARAPLRSGGAFLQATREPFDYAAPPPELAVLREALAPVSRR